MISIEKLMEVFQTCSAVITLEEGGIEEVCIPSVRYRREAKVAADKVGAYIEMGSYCFKQANILGVDKIEGDNNSLRLRWKTEFNDVQDVHLTFLHPMLFLI